MPTDGIASAANALRYWERRQEVMANNLANANTDGFKAERVFGRLLEDALPIPDASTDMRAGTVKPTGEPLDLALDGDGFVVVGTPNGERLARGGSFRLDERGVLTDTHGNELLGEKGPIRALGGTISIDRTGLVAVDGQVVDRLRVETVPPGTRLQHDAGTMFLPDAARTSVDIADRKVRQGYLEESNVSSVGSMVDMIDIQRTYASVQKVLTTLDSIRGLISNEIAKVNG
jgi:flagellar basal-body rod protein FlgG